MRCARVPEGRGQVPSGVYNRAERISGQHLNRVCRRSVRRRKGRGGAYKEEKNGDERLVRVGSVGMRTGGAGWWDDRGWEKTRRHAQDGLRRERVEERPYG